jgi:hypothetical protein
MSIWISDSASSCEGLDGPEDVSFLLLLTPTLIPPLITGDANLKGWKIVPKTQLSMARMASEPI